MKCRIMRHFICVFTVFKRTRLGVFRIQMGLRQQQILLALKWLIRFNVSIIKGISWKFALVAEIKQSSSLTVKSKIDNKQATRQNTKRTIQLDGRFGSYDSRMTQNHKHLINSFLLPNNVYMRVWWRKSHWLRKQSSKKAEFTVFFKDDDFENEETLKIRARSKIISTLHFATMKQYIKFS